jgi:hypothetical protein
MMRLRTLAALLLAAPLGAAQLQSVSDVNAVLDQVEKELAASQAKIEDMEPQVEELSAEIRKNKYGGSSNPEVSGSYGVLSRDLQGTGLLKKHGVGIVGKVDLSLLAHLPDSSTISVGFGPVFSPGSEPTWVVDDTDEIRRGNGTASRLGTLLGTFQLNLRHGQSSATAGFQSFQTSVLTLSGRLSDRPIVFDKNPYMSNTTTKAYYEGQFLTGVPKRAPEESEHYIMGYRVDLAGPWNSDLMLFQGEAEGYYDNDSVPHEYGGMLTLDERDSLGGKYKLIGFNRSNDTPEVLDLGGTTADAFFGLTNNTVFSAMAEQKLGKADLTMELAHANYDDPAVHMQGLAWRAASAIALGNSTLKLGVYGIDPGYMVIDPQGKYSNNGTNLLRYRQDPDSKTGGIIQQTNVSDPTIPMNNSLTYNVGGQLRMGNAFLNLNLINSQQQAATDSRIWSTHVLNGNNLNTSMWWVEFNDNYIGWLPISGRDAQFGHYGNPDMEREFFYNPRRDPPAAGFQNTTYPIDDYNQRYSLTNTAAAKTVFQPATIPDTNNKLFYNSSYRMLEAGLWRQIQEGILVVDPTTGKALPPSVKSTSYFTADLRMNLSDYIPLRKPSTGRPTARPPRSMTRA